MWVAAHHTNCRGSQPHTIPRYNTGIAHIRSEGKSEPKVLDHMGQPQTASESLRLRLRGCST